MNSVKNESFKIVNSVKNETFKMWFLWKMRHLKCEFCEKWDFEIVNSVKNETLKLRIWWKMRHWNCEFGEKWEFFGLFSNIVGNPGGCSYDRMASSWLHPFCRLRCFLTVFWAFTWAPGISQPHAYSVVRGARGRLAGNLPPLFCVLRTQIEN